MRRSDKLFLLGVALFIIAGVWVYGHFFNNPIYYPLGKYKPIKNPHPKYFMTVRGWIDPGLYNTLIFTEEYYSTNDKCEVTINHIEGVSIERTKAITYKIHTKNHRFSKKLPLDYYKPGFCKWHIVDISYSYWILKNNSFASFKLYNQPKWSKRAEAKQPMTSHASETILFTHSDYSYEKSNPFSDNLTVAHKSNLTYTLILKKK